MSAAFASWAWRQLPHAPSQRRSRDVRATAESPANTHNRQRFGRWPRPGPVRVARRQASGADLDDPTAAAAPPGRDSGDSARSSAISRGLVRARRSVRATRLRLSRDRLVHNSGHVLGATDPERRREVRGRWEAARIPPGRPRAGRSSTAWAAFHVRAWTLRSHADQEGASRGAPRASVARKHHCR